MSGYLFIAPLPPRGWRRILAAALNRWRAHRFRHSRRWTPVGLYDPNEETP